MEFAAREMEHIIRSASDQAQLPAGISVENNWTTKIFSGGKGELSRPLRSEAVEEEGFVKIKINHGSRQNIISLDPFLPGRQNIIFPDNPFKGKSE